MLLPRHVRLRPNKKKLQYAYVEMHDLVLNSPQPGTVVSTTSSQLFQSMRARCTNIDITTARNTCMQTDTYLEIANRLEFTPGLAVDDSLDNVSRNIAHNLS